MSLAKCKSGWMAFAMQVATCLVFLSRGSAATLGTAVLGTAEATNAACQAPSSVSTFQSTDAKGYLYYIVNGIQPTDQGRVDWVGPDGKIAVTHSYTAGNGSTNRCFWDALQIAGGPGAAQLGNWSVKVYWNNGLLASIAFQITRPSITLGVAVVSSTTHPASSVCVQPASQATYNSTDPTVYLYYIVNGILPTDQWHVDWVAPNGKVAATKSYTAGGNPGNRCFWEQLQIAFGPGEAQPGDWTVKVVWNGALLASVPFHISAVVRPTITSVVNGFSYVPRSVAPGSEIVIWGTGFGAASLYADQLPAATTVGNVTVQLDGRPIPIQSVDPTYIYALLPWAFPKDQGTLTVTVNGIPSAGFPLNVTRFAPGLLYHSSDDNSAEAYLFDAHGKNLGEMDGNNPAHRSDTVLVFATGLGPVDTPPADGNIGTTSGRSDTALPVAVSVGGFAAKLHWAHLLNSGNATPYTGSYNAGMSVVVFELPDGAPGGPAVPVTVYVGGKASQTLTLNIAGSGTKPNLPTLQSPGAVLTPFAGVTLKGSQFDPSALVTVHISDGKNFDVQRHAFDVTPTSLTFSVPPYLDPNTGNSAAASVSLSVVQSKGGTTVESTPLRLQIADLPQTTQPAGSITSAVLRASAHAATRLQGDLAFKQVATGGAQTSTRLKGALKAHSLAVHKVADAIDAVVKGEATSADLGTFNGQKAVLTQAKLTQLDRYLTGMYAPMIDAVAQATPTTSNGRPGPRLFGKQMGFEFCKGFFRVEICEAMFGVAGQSDPSTLEAGDDGDNSGWLGKQAQQLQKWADDKIWVPDWANSLINGATKTLTDIGNAGADLYRLSNFGQDAPTQIGNNANWWAETIPDHFPPGAQLATGDSGLLADAVKTQSDLSDIQGAPGPLLTSPSNISGASNGNDYQEYTPPPSRSVYGTVNDNAGNPCPQCPVSGSAKGIDDLGDAPVYSDGSYRMSVPVMDGMPQTGTETVTNEGSTVTQTGFDVTAGDDATYFQGTQTSDSPFGPGSGSSGGGGGGGILSKTHLNVSVSHTCYNSAGQRITASATFSATLPRSLLDNFAVTYAGMEVNVGTLPQLSVCTDVSPNTSFSMGINLVIYQSPTVVSLSFSLGGLMNLDTRVSTGASSAVFDDQFNHVVVQ